MTFTAIFRQTTMSMRYVFSYSLIAAVCLVASPSFSQAPDSLSLQGRLTTPGGVAIDTPSVGMVFKLYKAGVPVWTETHTGVAVNGGVFNVLLGGTTPLDTMAFNTPLEVGIKVGDDAEISPRTPLVAAAYAKALPGFYTVYRENFDGDRSGYIVVGGADNNVVGAEVIGATIGGGGGVFSDAPSPNKVLGDFGVVAGGHGNTVNSTGGTVGGGYENTAGNASTVGGGYENTASGVSATVGGGSGNTASGINATVGGGTGNTANGNWVTVPGGKENSAGGFASFAAGYRAAATHSGSFVWNDYSANNDTDTLRTTGVNQFRARAAGGFTFYTKSDTSIGATLATNTGSWASVSDVNAKTGFDQTNPTDILERLSAVPIQTWRYKGQDASITHMGPTAQDFYGAFGLGIDDKHIVTVDADGVSMAAIQGLYELVKQQQVEIERLRAAMERAGLE